MTNEQRRRASGAAMEASRRNSGAAMEASRRAGGAAMEANRRGQQVVEDIHSLAPPPAQRKTLRTIDPVGALPPRRGSGVYQAPAAGNNTGGGIASPLTEVPGSREYYASTVVIPSVDGSSYMAIQVPARIRMTDANGTEVVFQYRQVP
ncbi:hypothetical protein [Stutzerimonas stutzeri]|uniref:hypothetical protein n=1 Tax=Stutzerimonas stutzeri TaxID=316 RepID=UPI0026586C68|nr:hypothetical protein [Stutzerimonas stutzeri]MCF6780931.1 hypothetical protein [Stutzerimonas stutzeri]MCF6803500.1 hypothetical protein [Stutzerimonas stutzeri]